ncbi:kynureninase [Blastomonas fulva]|uniref:kynureninase n=1 Tax=Blastomonas fulva TaxID=1550728 RepID=UPI0025A3E659|nr:kynureninase [Blastomonas fulva]MDM7927130.1 kynureninase [Blastomonas fulva]MDM7967416.1 kynureninase [Blastomonas fulva]
MSTEYPSLSEAQARDAADPLRAWRDRFTLPQGVIYLDGNSLGALPKSTAVLMRDATERQWGEGLIRSWNDADWIGAPRRIGDKIAQLIRAAPGEVVVCDSVTVNLYKLMLALLASHPGQGRTILTESGNFPTDLHVAAGVERQHGLSLDAVPREQIADRIGPDTALIVLTHVHYKTGERFDMAGVQALADAHNVPLIWDLSHSVGAVPLDMGCDAARFAVGCGYKYLNGGPGAPGFVYVAGEALEFLGSPIQGWMGHAEPFAMTDGYTPAPGIERFLAGTPPMLSLLALEGGVDLMVEADDAALWHKSQALFDFLAQLMTARCPDLAAITPARADLRGSHASFAHPHAWPINRALIEAGVIGDFRTPDVLRLGLTPLYLGFADIWHAVDRLAAIMDDGRWQRSEYTAKTKVT